METLEEQVNGLREELRQINGAAVLKLSASGFDTVLTNFGPVTVQWVRSEKVGAGSRLTFKFGNPHDALLTDITLYGYLVGSKEETVGHFERAKIADLPEGSWKTTSIVIDEVPPEKIATVHLSAALVGGISLATK